MNIIILLAGPSNAFSEIGHKYPKTLIEVHNRPIIEHVIDNIRPLINNKNKIIFVTRESDNTKFYLDNILQLLVPGSSIISVIGDTAGAAISTLLAIEEINQKEQLLILNGDQIIDENLQGLVDKFGSNDADAGTVVFKSVHPRWSYVRCDDNGYVIEAAEKKPISNFATAGFYFYRKAGDFIKYAKQMIIKDAHIDNMFYVCPVFNEMILAQKKISIIEIDNKKYHSLMDPEMINIFENLETNDA